MDGDLVDVGQLSPQAVDTVKIGISNEYEALSRLLRGVQPGLQRGQFRVIELVLPIFEMVQTGPVAP